MSHQRYPSHDPVKEPHSITLKVLRLSRPSLVTQDPFKPPLSPSSQSQPSPSPASLAYTSTLDTNPSPFLLSPILKLPVSFGSTYIGETFSCTLCANNELPPGHDSGKQIRDVRIEAEMKTPGTAAAAAASGRTAAIAHKLELSADARPRDLEPGETLQGVVSFDLKDEGTHVLAVTVSYYEATETSGRTRTFRKLYQFICKSSLIVRTKMSPLPPVSIPQSTASRESGQQQRRLQRKRRRWALEAQLENCGDDTVQLDSVSMDCEAGLRHVGCNWGDGDVKPVLHPGEVEQVCFVVEEEGGEKVQADDEKEDGDGEGRTVGEVLKPTKDGRIVVGVLGIGWRGEMGNRGFLSTGKLGTKVRA